jgi:vacuolar-type H+-ATPase subunit F/Vma7
VARVAVIGEHAAVVGYTLAGAVVVPADDAEAVRTAWDRLPGDVEVVVLTARAARVLGSTRTEAPLPLTVVMPS